MNDTVLTVLGKVGSDVRQVVTAKGALLTSFRLASTPRRPDRQTGEWVDGTTTWYSVVAWRNLADNIAASLSKGDPVIVHGRLRTVAWERDGRTGETLEIEDVSVGPDLNRGRAVYRRVLRASDRSRTRDTASGAADLPPSVADEADPPSGTGDEPDWTDDPSWVETADPSEVDRGAGDAVGADVPVGAGAPVGVGAPGTA